MTFEDVFTALGVSRVEIDELIAIVALCESMCGMPLTTQEKAERILRLAESDVLAHVIEPERDEDELQHSELVGVENGEEVFA